MGTHFTLPTHQEVSGKHEQVKTPPYLFKISKGDQFLYYLGVWHTSDPSNPQFIEIEKLFRQFLDQVRKDNIIILNEGGTRPFRDSRDESIQKDGEPGFITYLSHQAGAEVTSPEPDDKVIDEALLKEFPKEEIGYYYFARTAKQWHRRKEGDFKEYIQRFLDKHNLGFKVEDMIAYHDKKHGHLYSQDDTDCFSDDSNPSYNPVTTRCADIRDHFIISEIVKYWNEGKSIFIAYGLSHALRQERALKELLK